MVSRLSAGRVQAGQLINIQSEKTLELEISRQDKGLFGSNPGDGKVPFDLHLSGLKHSFHPSFLIISMLKEIKSLYNIYFFLEDDLIDWSPNSPEAFLMKSNEN